MSDFIPGRYPYTYGADYLRILLEESGLPLSLSRSEASFITRLFEKILDLQYGDLSKKLADQYLIKYGIVRDGSSAN